jgi:hypothetical protein
MHAIFRDIRASDSSGFGTDIVGPQFAAGSKADPLARPLL